MSIEHILFIIFFLVLPLLQRIAEERRKRRTEKLERWEPEADVEEPVEQRPAPPPPVTYTPPPPPPPVVYTPPPPPPPVVYTQPAVPATEVRAEPPKPARKRRPTRAQPTHAGIRDLLPRDRQGLQRAMLLLEILGPPRALEPATRRF